MGYYRGDYYRGDYYRGDPGIFSGIGKFLGKVGRVALGTAGGFLTGGPLGAAMGGARALIGRGGQGPSGTTAMQIGQLGPIGYQQQSGLVNIQRQQFGPMGGGQRPKINPATGLPWRRRMNVTNVKALRRAIRRARGFTKIARKSVGLFGLTVVRSGGRGGSRGVITRSEAAKALRA